MKARHAVVNDLAIQLVKRGHHRDECSRATASHVMDSGEVSYSVGI